MSCEPVGSASVNAGDPALSIGAGGPVADVVLGGNLALLSPSGPASYADGVLSQPVSVRNLTTQPLGTANGITPDPDGVRVFFHALPAVTAGIGTVTVEGADGVGTFTGSGQPFFRYIEMLAPGAANVTEKRWKFRFPATVESFAFQVYVTARQPDETRPTEPLARPQFFGASRELVVAPGPSAATPFVQFVKSGGAMVARADPATGAIVGATILLNDGRGAVVGLYPDGKPAGIKIDETTILFANQTETTLDLALVDPNGDVRIRRNVSLATLTPDGVEEFARRLEGVPGYAPGKVEGLPSEFASAAQTMTRADDPYVVSIGGFGFTAAQMRSLSLSVELATCGASLASVAFSWGLSLSFAASACISAHVSLVAFTYGAQPWEEAALDSYSLVFGGKDCAESIAKRKAVEALFQCTGFVLAAVSAYPVIVATLGEWWDKLRKVTPPLPNVGGIWGGAIWGDPHLSTMDRRQFSFQAVGDFVLVRSTNDGDPFEVQARYRAVGDLFSVLDGAAMNVNGDVVNVLLTDEAGRSLLPNYELVVNDSLLGATPRYSGRLPSGGTLQVLDGIVTVTWPDQTVARIRRGQAEVFLPWARSGKVEGLLGNFDRDPSNDLKVRGGPVLALAAEADIYGAYRESWRVPLATPASLFRRGPELWDVAFPRKRPSVVLAEMPDASRQQAETVCRAAGVIDDAVLQACVFDVAVSGNTSSGEDGWARMAASRDPYALSVTVSPALSYAPTGGTLSFRAAVSGARDPGVTWSVTGGTIVVTGEQAMTFTAPSAVGEYRVTATSKQDGRVMSTATVIVDHSLGPVATLELVSGDAQTELAGVTLRDALRVRARDAAGVPVKGATVQWTVVAGVEPGSITPPSVVTREDGLASAAWTLGWTTGAQTARATVAALPAVTFTATARPNNRAPIPTITAPVEGAEFDWGAPVTMSGSATDPEDGELPPSALTWTSDVGGALGTGASVTTRTLAAGPHIITLTARDSFGATFSRTVRISVRPRPANQPPTVAIASPIDGAVVNAGQSVALVGAASDPEDGPLGGAALVWTSDRDGALGTGASLSLATLTAGVHVITLTATDSRGGSTVATVRLTVNGMPVVAIASPAAGASFAPGAPIVLAGSGSDPEDGTLGGGALTWSSSRDGALGTGASLTMTTLSSGPHTITLTATDTRGATATASVPILVLRASMTLPATAIVSIGGIASLPVQLLDPAPSGGLTVALVSNAPGIVRVVTPTVTVPAGALTANAQIAGVTGGTATIRATADGYVAATSAVTATGGLNIEESSTRFTADRTASLTVRLESGGNPVAAPAGGVAVTFTPASPACVAAISPVTIAAGLVSTQTTVSYGGTAALPCNTTVTASVDGQPGITTDVATVYVDKAPPPPPIVVANYYAGSRLEVGAGLRLNGQSSSYYLYLGAPAPAGGVALTLTSSNPSVARVALSTTSSTPSAEGTGSATVTIPAGSSSAYFAVDGVEGANGEVTLTLSAPGYTGTSLLARVRALALSLSTIGTTTSLSPNSNVTAQVCLVNDAGTDVWYCPGQVIRPGGTPVAVTVTNSDAAVGQLVPNGGTPAQSATATIAVGASQSPYFGAGAFEFDPLGAGTTTLRATAPGIVAGPSATRTVTVTAPAIFMANYYAGSRLEVGAGLRLNGQSSSYYLYLGAPAPAGGLALTLSSTDPSRALVALSTTSSTPSAEGTGSATVTIPAGSSSAYFAVDGVEGANGTTTITASAPGFTSFTANVNVRSLALYLGAPSSTTSLSSNSSVYAMLCLSNDAGTDYYNCPSQPVRPGGTPVTVTFANSDAEVGQLVPSGGTAAQTVVSTVGVGAYQTPYSGAGAVEFDPLGAGTTQVRATSPGILSGTSARRTVTVTAPAITFASSYYYGSEVPVGAGLRAVDNSYLRVDLGAPAPAGGLALTLASSDPARALVSLRSGSTYAEGAGSATVTIPAGQSSAYFAVDGVEGASGVVTLTVSAPGFTSASANVRVRALALYLGAPSTTTSLSPNSPVYATLCLANDVGTDYYSCPSQFIRPGGTPVTITFRNSAAGVAQLVAGALVAQSVAATIPVGANQTPYTGVVEFDPLGAGTTIVSVTASGVVSGPSASRSVSVSVPTIAFSAASGTVTSGTRLGCQYVSLAAPAPAGAVLTLTSSSGAALQVGSQAGCGSTYGPAGTSIAIPLTTGQSTVYFAAYGQSLTGTVTLTASVPGYTDGTRTFTVVAPTSIMATASASPGGGSP